MVREAVKFGPDIEHAAEYEQELTRDILAEMAATQRDNADRHRHAHRDAHAKSHAVLKATVTVHESLPPELAQGIFAEPRTFDAVVRLSSSPGDIRTDRTPAPRGCALKVIGVEGERLVPDIGGNNQDVLMVNFPTLAFGTIAKYKDMLSLLEKAAKAPETLQRLTTGAMSIARDVATSAGLTPGATLEGLGRDNSHVLGETYFTQAALRYGDFVAKLSVSPKSANVRALTGVQMDVDDFSAIRDLVVDYFKSNDAEYELRAQLCTDIDAMPVEDAAVLWSEDASPHRPVATIRINRQDTYGPARRAYGDDTLTFNPWNGVQDHRPLGSIMRVRKHAYERSTAYRHEYNARKRVEPSSLDDIPD